MRIGSVLKKKYNEECENGNKSYEESIKKVQKIEKMSISEEKDDFEN